MKNYILLIASIGVFTLFCCEDAQDNVGPVPQTVINASLDLFDGEVLQGKQEDEDGATVWEVKIRNGQGAEVVTYWTIDKEILVKIKGEIGPFDYDIQPGNQLVNFASAQTIAIGAIKNSALTKWELAKEEDFVGDWVYSFEFEGTEESIKVFLNAKSGDVIQIDY